MGELCLSPITSCPCFNIISNCPSFNIISIKQHFRRTSGGIFRIAQLKHFDYYFDTVTQTLVLNFGSNKGLLFENEEFRSILGFKGMKDTSHHGFFNIGYKWETAGNSSNRHSAQFPVGITSGSELIFVYVDVRAPVIKILESKGRL